MSDNASRNYDKESPPPRKMYTATVCMVPPPSATQAWADLTKARADLRDPGYFRWPPHANILYPFLDVKEESMLEETVQHLRNATKQCPPFTVSLDTLGTFGGKKRGVLWVYPRSSYREKEGQPSQGEEEPLIRLQALLEKEFSICTDQRKSGRYTPHMTLSHFSSLDEAKSAQSQIEEWWPNDIHFLVEEIYLLKRKGDEGQFLRVATISLGNEELCGIELHDPPSPFPAMPLEEEGWVKEERMKLKARRNTNQSWKGRRGRRGRGRRRTPGEDPRGPSRSTDTPEVIAAKRAARKAKRERLERERLAQEAKDTSS